MAKIKAKLNESKLRKSKKKIVVIPGIFDIQYECKPLYEIVQELGFELIIFRYKSFGRESFFDIEKEFETFLKKHKPVGIIGFSNGGTIAVGAKHNLPILSICGPLHGTLTSYIHGTIGFKQIRFGSDYLAHIKKMILKHDIVSVYSYLETIIIPGTSSKAGDSRMILCPIHAFSNYWPRTKRICNEFLQNLL